MYILYRTEILAYVMCHVCDLHLKYFNLLSHVFDLHLKYFNLLSYDIKKYHTLVKYDPPIQLLMNAQN
jgi:hypothetical protein